MAKVFRLHQGQDGSGWFVSRPLNHDDLETIKTDGKEVATSIPSPFARIDLVKSAFRWVTVNGIEGNTAQHKLVSDSLDIAQLFFIYPRHKEKFRIISWRPQERFDALVSDLNNPRHLKLAETLKISWAQDSLSQAQTDKILYNFERVNKLYFILNKSNGAVIGGTSPATLFFAAPDANQVIQPHTIHCGSDILLDNEYVPLHKREEPFIEYIYALSKQPNFSKYFPEVFAYLERIRMQLLHDVIKEKVTLFNTDTINNYNPCPVLDNDDYPCEIIGIPLKTQRPLRHDEFDSDFLVKPDVEISGIKPLILPADKFTHQWKYTPTTLWNENTEIPFKNDKSASESVLPVQGDYHYWLSIGNFLEDKIIELPYTIDSGKFTTCGSKKYLLPLSSTFFKYFKSEKIPEYLQMTELAGGGIEVTLDIPVKRGKITFKKKYNQADNNVVKIDMHLVILPFLKTNHLPIDYTIGVLDARTYRNEQIDISGSNEGATIELLSPVVRNQGSDGTVKSYYYKLNLPFDALQVKCGEVCGYIIPKLKQCNGNQQVHFAVDFGTTNTHIEYRIGNSAEKALESSSETPIWQSLIDLKNHQDPINLEKITIFEKEIIPYEFSSANKYRFPFRTALSFNQNIDFSSPIEPFRHTNNFFLFEKLYYPTYLNLRTQLKWSNYSNTEDEHLVQSYIAGLMLLMLYKSILLNGNPNNTIITWFYPVSMDEYEQGIFREAWQDAYRKLFKQENANNLKSYPESIAPYLFYRAHYPGLSLSIDVGGGSSDIAVFEKEENMPRFISSFKFAGNSIFGDGFPSPEFRNNSDTNGFVLTYLEEVKKIIQAGTQKDEILQDIVNNRKDSADFSSFLFSLEKEPEINFSYTSLLRKNKKIKLPILIFYSAVIYYSANLMKKSGIVSIPKNILLSGTAAKTALIIDTSEDKKNLSKLFSYLFGKVMNEQVPHKINIALAMEPKEITCKGALKLQNQTQTPHSPIFFWIGGKDNGVWSEVLNKETDINRIPKYNSIDENVEELIVSSINDFYEILDTYVNEFSIENNHGIDIEGYDVFKKMRTENIKDYLRQGLKAYNKNQNKHIEESLFFYPLTGILNKLAYQLTPKKGS